MTGSHLLIALGAFAVGAIPFSWLFSRVFAGKDLAKVGDGNPGAWNAFKAGGWKVGVPALALDITKGWVPAALARSVWDLHGLELVLVGVAPVAGHAFSPFLRFRGGKAIATIFGTWAGLTAWIGPVAMALPLLLSMRFQKNDAWTALFSQIVLLLLCLVLRFPWELSAVAAGHVGISAFKQRKGLARPIELRRRSGG